MGRAARTTPDQLGRARGRSWFERKVLDGSAGQIHRLHGAAKEAAIGSMSGTVVEIGPGTGPNLRYYPPGVKVVAIEPNEHMHAPLREEAARLGVDLEIRTLQGEQLDVGDGVAGGVVATLVLCGVDDPEAVLAEIRRVLAPGGTYFFLEHVAAEPGTPTRRFQDALFRPHRWLFNGCETNRDTAAAIDAAGFARVDHRRVDGGLASLYVKEHLVGTAVK